MKERLRKFDKGLARGEAAIAMAVLLSLIVVAAAQSFLRNVADQDVSWANDALLNMGWADPFMEKATLWLAMLGASLATHYDKHIGIDILSRLAKPKPRAAMRGVVSVFAGLTSFYFARVVMAALLNKAGRIPGEYAVYNADDRTVHICTGTATDIANAGLERPDLFCGARSFFESFGLTVNTPERMMDLLVPAMFCIIAARLLAIGVNAFMRIPTGGIPDSELGGADSHSGADAASVSAVPVPDDQDAFGEKTSNEEDETKDADAPAGNADDDADDASDDKEVGQ